MIEDHGMLSPLYTLERIDFFRFNEEFIQLIKNAIPGTGQITFFDAMAQQPADSKKESKKERSARQAIVKASEKGCPVLTNNALYLSFPVQPSTVIAEVKSLDDYFRKRIGRDWLEELQSKLLHDFVLTKRANIDSLTGLLSSFNLHETLDRFGQGHSSSMILLSIPAGGVDSFYARHHRNRLVSLLNTFVSGRFPVYYVGQSCFALLCPNVEDTFLTSFPPLLLDYFKREGCSRVHISCLALADINVSGEERFAKICLKKAWAALHVASKRGPFAFCNVSVLENQGQHPLAPPSASVKRWLQKVARGFDTFALLSFADVQKDVAEKIGKKIGDIICQDGASWYLFSPENDKKKVSAMGKKIIQIQQESDKDGKAINVGISFYCPKNGPKSMELINCQKALRHAAFLDDGSVVICNAVTFNVSGDIYYGDGDFVQAVTEYKQGLQRNPDDGNLLNSLGVCYAQMNRHKDAIACFRKASKSKDDRFMALYNLGLEQQLLGDNLAAIDSFSKALDCIEDKEQKSIRKDITFQLSVLCTLEKQYKKAMALLGPWYEEEGNGKALKYLGEIYFRLGDNRLGMKYLQQATRYDEYDADVLGLLGEIYLIENEGDDIALRFCEKAVELNPDSLPLKIRLARAQIQCGDYSSAEKNLRLCLRNKQTRLAALKAKAVVAKEQGKDKSAANWISKAEKFAAGN